MPIVLYLQQLVPSLLYKHVDLCGACIQAVLQHLFEGGAWALDDLACSNAIHHGLVELADDRWGSGRRHAARRHALSVRLRLAHVAQVHGGHTGVPYAFKRFKVTQPWCG